MKKGSSTWLLSKVRRPDILVVTTVGIGLCVYANTLWNESEYFTLAYHPFTLIATSQQANVTFSTSDINLPTRVVVQREVTSRWSSMVNIFSVLLAMHSYVFLNMVMPITLIGSVCFASGFITSDISSQPWWISLNCILYAFNLSILLLRWKYFSQNKSIPNSPRVNYVAEILFDDDSNVNVYLTGLIQSFMTLSDIILLLISNEFDYQLGNAYALIVISFFILVDWFVNIIVLQTDREKSLNQIDDIENAASELSDGQRNGVDILVASTASASASSALSTPLLSARASEHCSCCIRSAQSHGGHEIQYSHPTNLSG